MKKIAFYIDSMGLGGANRVMSNLVSYFYDNGYDVCLINDVSMTEKEEYPLPKGIKRYIIHNEGKHHFFLSKQLKILKEIRRILKENKTEVVVSFMGPPNIRILLGTLGMKVKKVVSVRNDPYKEYGAGIKRFLARIIFCLADGCVFQTEEAMDYFPKKVKKRSKIILNPIKEVFYQTEYSDTNSGIVSVGRLFSQKNHELLIRAFARIADSYPNENLYIYGEGSSRKELQDLIVKFELQNRAFLPGSVMDVNVKLSQAKIFVLSSDYEGMPNALLEAMAVGVPVISTDCPCGGPRTVIENENQGLLVQVGDVEKMADALEKLLNDSYLRKQMSVAEKERAKDFRNDAIMPQWEQYLTSRQ